MQLIRGQLQLTQRLPQCVATLGSFDGFHLGHQQLLSALRKQAHRHALPTAVIMFEPYPYTYFNPDRALPRLMRFREKWHYLIGQDIDYLVCLHFNKLLAQLSAENFVKTILVEQLGIRSLIIGDDFRFGAKRQGDFNLLQAMGLHHGFEVMQLPTFKKKDQRVSSTRVRTALQSADLATVNELLGQPYFLCGKVIHGDARGRQLGFATANICLGCEVALPAGVYVVQVRGLDTVSLPAVASIGARPMFPDPYQWLEVHLLNFDKNIYGCRLQVEFLSKIRDQIHFSNLDALMAHMHQDVQATVNFFGEKTKGPIL